ncbi:helix-turn-helix domain-containing protein [Silvibacterium sp.]|uniref:helix-turn-helix domain-containing protein n=1 Tax=Silvibacterium sp. TaxID=1964179 RepID=UPI0039E549DC
MENLASVGHQVAAARRGAALRQIDLAERAGVSRATLDALENGRATDISFSRLARILDSLGMQLTVGQLGSPTPLADLRQPAKSRKTKNSPK